jgi:hypothetical protein
MTEQQLILAGWVRILPDGPYSTRMYNRHSERIDIYSHLGWSACLCAISGAVLADNDGRQFSSAEQALDALGRMQMGTCTVAQYCGVKP